MVVTKGEEQKEVIEEIQQQMKNLEGELKLKEKKFFGGECLGFLDIVGSIIIWLLVAQEALGMEVLNQEKLPLLHEWLQRLVEDSIFKECVPPKDRHLHFFKLKYGSK